MDTMHESNCFWWEKCKRKHLSRWVFDYTNLAETHAWVIIACFRGNYLIEIFWGVQWAPVLKHLFGCQVSPQKNEKDE